VFRAGEHLGGLKSGDVDINVAVLCATHPLNNALATFNENPVC
jgi:hypothetical protein